MRYPDRREGRVRRESALARPEVRTPLGGFVSVTERLPEPGKLVRARVVCRGSDPYTLPFDVVFRGGQWFNSKRDVALQAEVIAWQYRIGS